MPFIGIDPGLSGGISVKWDNSHIEAHKMPPDTHSLVELLRSYPPESSYVLMEQQQARARYSFETDPETGKRIQVAHQGMKSTWTFGVHYGQILGIIAALNLPLQEIRPKDWMRLLGIRAKRKDESQNAWKNFLKEKAQSMFPQIRVTLATADSLLIAELCSRLLSGRIQRNTWDSL